METRRHGAIHRYDRLWHLQHFSISAFQHGHEYYENDQQHATHWQSLRHSFHLCLSASAKGRPWAQAGSITRTLWGGVATRHDAATHMMALAESLASKELEDVA